MHRLVLPIALLVLGLCLGYAAATQRASAAAHRAQAQHALELSRALAAARRADAAQQQQLDQQLQRITTQHQQELARVQTAHQVTADRLRTRAVSVSIRAAACLPPAAGAPGAADPAPRAELDPETAIALDRIAADGDAAILDLNACLDSYAAARAAVSQARERTLANATPAPLP